MVRRGLAKATVRPAARRSAMAPRSRYEWALAAERRATRLRCQYYVDQSNEAIGDDDGVFVWKESAIGH